MPVLRYFLIDGDDGGSFGEMDEITVEQANQAIRDSKAKGLDIELYLSRSKTTEVNLGSPEIGLVFRSGVYEGHGIGPSKDEPFSWMWTLLRYANRLKGCDMSEHPNFMRTIVQIASVGCVGKT